MVVFPKIRLETLKKNAKNKYYEVADKYGYSHREWSRIQKKIKAIETFNQVILRIFLVWLVVSIFIDARIMMSSNTKVQVMLYFILASLLLMFIIACIIDYVKRKMSNNKACIRHNRVINELKALGINYDFSIDSFIEDNLRKIEALEQTFNDETGEVEVVFNKCKDNIVSLHLFIDNKLVGNVRIKIKYSGDLFNILKDRDENIIDLSYMDDYSIKLLPDEMAKEYMTDDEETEDNLYEN